MLMTDITRVCCSCMSLKIVLEAILNLVGRLPTRYHASTYTGIGIVTGPCKLKVHRCSI
jgi:hypothetical protein